MMERICITGGAGYVGTSLIPQLLNRGFSVRVFDNLMFGGDQLIPFFQSENFEFVKGDIRNPDEVEAAVSDCDVIIHLAAIVGYPACRKYPQLAEETNVQGSKNIADAVSRDQLVLFGSTLSNYGANKDICTEDSPLNPLSIYGKTKIRAETYLLENANAVAFRFATAFGLSPRFRLDLLVNDFTYKAVTQQYLVVYEQNFMRAVIHVRDIGRAYLFAIDNANLMCGQIYNVGSDDMNYSKRQLCELIQKHVPQCYVHYAEVGSDPDKRDYSVSTKKINKLGYYTTISLEDGIIELIRVIPAISVKNQYTNE